MHRTRKEVAGLFRAGRALVLSAALLLPATAAIAAEVYDRTGTASWYGARYQGRPWTATGHRLLLPVYDAAGVMRSVL